MDERIDRDDGVFIRRKRPGFYEVLSFARHNVVTIAQAIYDKKEVRLYIGADNDFHIIASPLTEIDFRR